MDEQIIMERSAAASLTSQGYGRNKLEALKRHPDLLERMARTKGREGIQRIIAELNDRDKATEEPPAAPVPTADPEE